jgi:hypothetical protein
VSNLRDLLILKHQDFRTEVSGFFKELNKDSALRNLFFTNPSLVLRTKLPSLSDINISEPRYESANRVLFSVLSNDKFKTFLKEYQERKNEAIERFLKSPEDKRAAAELDERTMRAEVAEALLEFGDKELLSSLLGASGSIDRNTRSFSTLVLLEILVAIVAVAVHAVVFLGTSGDFAPTSPGRLPISAQALRKIANQLVATAQQARQSGDLIQ